MAGASDDDAGRTFAERFARALTRREGLMGSKATQAWRAFSGAADGCDGVFVDVYAAGAVLIVYEGRISSDPTNAAGIANVVLDRLKPLGVRAVYHKPFARDRSRLGGALPACVSDPQPLAGEPLPESILIREYDWQLEVRLYDGLSTGLFLDQRENRRWVSQWVRNRGQGNKAGRASPVAPAVLNTFAYTCAFSVAAACAGAITTSVDVSGRYLDWGKRNFAHNQLADLTAHRFARMDTFEFFGYARRKGLRYDLIVLDPPSFASGSKKKGIRPWSSVEDYARLVNGAAALLKPRGAILASTNTQELCRPGRLEREIRKGLDRAPRWLELPAPPVDFAGDQDRFAAMAFAVE